MSSQQNQDSSAPAEGTATPSIISDPMLATLAEDLGITVETAPETPSKAAESVKPVEEAVVSPKPAEPEKPSPPKIAPPVIKRDKRKEMEEIVENALKKANEKPPLPKAEEKKEADTKVDLSKYSEEQQAELEMAKFAEAFNPAKYSGRYKKQKDYFDSVDKYVQEHRNDPDRTFDENDDQFVRFVNSNKPKWSAAEIRMLTEAQVTAKATEEAKKTLAPEIENAKRLAMEARVLPSIENQLQKFDSSISSEFNAGDKFASEYFQNAANEYGSLAETFLRISHGLDAYNAADTVHNRVYQFVMDQSDALEKIGGNAVIRGGKRFVSPDKMAAMTQSKDPKASNYWTFNSEDVVKMLSRTAVIVAKHRIKQAEEKYSEHGFVRKPASQSPSKENQTPAVPTSGPKAQPTIAPGAGETSSINDGDHPGKDIIKTLGLSA